MDDFRFPWEEELSSRRESAEEPSEESLKETETESELGPLSEGMQDTAGGNTVDPGETVHFQEKNETAQNPGDELPDSSKGYFQQDDLGVRRSAKDESGSGYHSSYDAYRFHDPEDTRGTYRSGSENGTQGSRNQQETGWNGSNNSGQDYGNSGWRSQNGGQGYQNSNWNSQNGSQGYQNGSWNNQSDGKNRKTGGKKPKRNRNGGGKKAGFAVLLVAVFAVVFGIVFAAASSFLRSGTSTGSGTASTTESSAAQSAEEVILGNHDSEEDASEDEESVSAGESGTTHADVSSGGEMTTQQVVSKVMPSMVAITNVTVSEYQNFFGESETYENVSAGSGIIVGKTDEDLLIATNNHVISGSSDITVTFVDESAVAGSIKGTDADNDLAIVAVSLDDIAEDTLDAISIVEIGDSDALQVGESVVAIGNALGYGQSVSKGIVSALNRVVEDTDGTQRELIQTDASINPGNSGGALLNMNGQLVGINEAKYVDESVEGVGYAIPMAVAEPILTKLGSNTARTKVSEDEASYIGISAQTMPSYYTESGYPEGVYVAEVTPGGPAEEAGIEEGDIITSLDGTAVTTSDALVNLLTYYAAGEEVEVSVSRMNSDRTGFEKKKFTVTLGSRADMPSQTESTSQEENSGSTTDNRGGFPSAGDFYEYFFGNGEGEN